jgi:hypothetical protein
MPIERPGKVALTKVAFDLDGVLDQAPIAALARLLFEAGVEVHIITVGALDMDAGEDEPEADDVMRARKIERLAFLSVPFTMLHVVTGVDFAEAGEEKAALVNYYGLQIVIDDSSSFVKAMVADTTAMILHLKPGGSA